MSLYTQKHMSNTRSTSSTGMANANAKKNNTQKTKIRLLFRNQNKDT